MWANFSYAFHAIAPILLLIALGMGAVYVAALFLLHQWAAPQEAVALDLRLAALAVAAAGAGLLASKTPRRTRR